MDGAELGPSKGKQNATYGSAISAVLIQSNIQALCSALSRLYGEPRAVSRFSRLSGWPIGVKVTAKNIHWSITLVLSNFASDTHQPDKDGRFNVNTKIVLLSLWPTIVHQAASKLIPLLRASPCQVQAKNIPVSFVTGMIRFVQC
jgi:hypothetical protein